jgi:tRNA-specific 2-thiouridylase
MSRIAVALSGGVDSAVVAALLLEQGHEVIGITGKMTNSDESELVVNNAKKVAEKLNIQHFVYDATRHFETQVLEYFKNSYKNGETPNPCIMCNKHIKWGCIFNYAIKELGADYIATGHYANIKKDNNIYKLFPASDEHKDQLYFLFTLSQEQLARTVFPLSKYKKAEVKKIAEKYDLPPKSAKESQDICFIKAPITTKKYLNNLFSAQEGLFIKKTNGKILGKHNGYWQYTIGQRKGIGLAAPKPLYVVDIDATNNIVYVDYQQELYKNSLKLNNINW